MSSEERGLVTFPVPQSSSFLCSSVVVWVLSFFETQRVRTRTVIFDRPIGWTKLCRSLCSWFLLVIVPEGCKRKPNERFRKRLKLCNPIRSRDFHRAVRNTYSKVDRLIAIAHSLTENGQNRNNVTHHRHHHHHYYHFDARFALKRIAISAAH
ncbi:hypothetical protein F5Y00DRAFT_184122 [Daldinia vernicosa]|uniref:uncharacterized protein n=1 Tax=Daldinia vernicosa TaxID=114800 RepID=UPI002007D040|nr:uncharacterized protein F5Y00DRAFT_184122 [Daldinia vernicosa]KAI0845049.1 hypothetical protein F5Y00DRAFT_184122 [Daldinia vernicosa]